MSSSGIVDPLKGAESEERAKAPDPTLAEPFAVHRFLVVEASSRLQHVFLLAIVPPLLRGESIKYCMLDRGGGGGGLDNILVPALWADPDKGMVCSMGRQARLNVVAMQG